MSSRVLIVDEDMHSGRALTALLTSRGYDVRQTEDAESAVLDVRQWRPAAVIASLNLPIFDGIELCRRIRRISNVPTIIMSNDPDTASEIAALEAGADDYIVRPFGSERVLARLRLALRRRFAPPESAPLGVGEFHIDFDGRRVSVHGQPVRLTPKEFDLFVFMARHPNRVLPRKTLLEAVWGKASEDQPEYLRVFMGQLRKKLESDPSNPRYLLTEPWVGYRFNPTGPSQ